MVTFQRVTAGSPRQRTINAMARVMKRHLLLGASMVALGLGDAYAQSTATAIDVSKTPLNLRLAAAMPATDSVTIPSSAGAGTQLAQTNNGLAAMPPENVLVSGRAEYQIGRAAAASEGAVAGVDLSVRPILRPGELFEVVPGLIAAQHSGSGKANQWFLRGMNLDHGTDFTAIVDGVPWNLRSHGHGQGYLDINGLIPETVARIDYRKGPYRADVGDFSLAGAAQVGTVDGYDRPWAQVEGGMYGYYRAVGGKTFDVGGGQLTAVGQYKTYNGPWQQPENLQHFSGWTKYIKTTSMGVFDATLSGYTATWRSTEQIPENAIGGTFFEPGDPSVPAINCPNRFCATDPTQNGLTTRWIGTARMLGEGWRANIYGQYYNWHMSSNPTGWLDDPVNGDQLLQRDRRSIFGGRAEKDFDFGDEFQVRVGIDGRYDDITNVGVAHTVANMFLDSFGSHRIREGSIAAYTEAYWTPIEGLRLMGGARADHYSFNVKGLDAVSLSGKAESNIATPKAGIAYRLTDTIEAYANYGQGFHSNDARGVTVGSPLVPGLVRGIGKEIGTRFQQDNFNVSVAYWWLNNDQELIFVGDSNTVEPKTGSKREGVEIIGYWRPFEWLAFDGVYAHTKARFVNSPGADRLPQAPDGVGEFGVSAIRDQFEASMRLRYLGPYAMVEDNSQRQQSVTLVNFRFAWKPAPWVVTLELLNALDSKRQDIAYFYTTRLPGQDPAGIDGRVSRAVEPRTVRMGLKYLF